MRPAASGRGWFSRRDFLSVSGRVGVAALGLMLSGAHPHRGQGKPAVTGDKLTVPPGAFDLKVTETTWELAPGKVIQADAYNGQIPGPVIRAKEGEMLWVLLRTV